MSPAANSDNWLTFSLSPMEMLASSQPPMQLLPPPLNIPHSHHYYMEPFYSNDWVNNEYVVDQPLDNPTPPKLEDFFGGDSVTSYNSQTESVTQDTSSQLTHIYDPNPTHNYFAHSNPNPHAFSANSGSEVDDSQLGCAGSEFVAQSIESTHLVSGYNGSGSGSGFGSGSGENLSLAVVAQNEDAKAIIATGGESDNNINTNNNVKKIADNFGQRTSIYRGVTRHRWTGRYEAHLWDNSCRREGQARKGRQVYLGGYDKEDKAARSYDLAALKYWGPTATTNFPISTYTKELEEMKHATKQEFIASLRRKSSGFSRGASIYRGVTRHHQQGRWQARIGRVAGNKDLYLGTFATEEEAAEAYDIAAIKFRGVNAVTNFEMNRYDVEAILNSNLPIGGAAKRLKLGTQSSTDQKPALTGTHMQSTNLNSSAVVGGTINFGSMQGVPPIACAVPFDAATAMFHQNLLHHFGSNGLVQGVPSELPYGSGTVPAEFYIWPHQSY